MLSEKEKQSVKDLANAWDLPLLTDKNRRWLFEKLLIHAVSKDLSKKNPRHIFFNVCFFILLLF